MFAGLTLWECLYGSRPFDEPTDEGLLEAIARGELRVDETETAPGIPRRLRQVVARGLAPDAGEIAHGGSDAASEEILPEVELLAEELIRLIDAGELDEAQRRWAEVEHSAAAGDRIIKEEALGVTRALMTRALAIEHQEPSKATTLALHAYAPLFYSSSRFPLDHPAQAELDSLRDESTRLTSSATRLLGRYTESRRDELEHACSCDPPVETYGCDDEPDVSIPALHACLAELLVDHDDELFGYLSCLAPATQSHTACVTSVTDCEPAAIASCGAARARAMAECPALAADLRRAFTRCTR